MEITSWIQSADFNSRDLGIARKADIVHLIQTHPWQSELQKMRELQIQGKENCPPGLGLVAGKGRVLHLCPTPEGSWNIHHHKQVQRRVFGFFSSNQGVSEYLEEISCAEVLQLVDQFLQEGEVTLPTLE